MSGQQHAPAVLYPRERPGTHCTGGWVGLRAGLDGEKSRPTGIRSPDHPARSSVAIPTELPGPHVKGSVRPKTCLEGTGGVYLNSVFYLGLFTLGNDRTGTQCIGGCVAPTGFRSPDLPVHRESLYRLRCPGQFSR